MFREIADFLAFLFGKTFFIYYFEFMKYYVVQFAQFGILLRALHKFILHEYIFIL